MNLEYSHKFTPRISHMRAIYLHSKRPIVHWNASLWVLIMSNLLPPKPANIGKIAND